ncbi:hypothetical protein J6P92_09425 [bacterium]|nr:hypothetical protein [bacterium]
MSFDVNVLSSKPIIKAAASMQNDGGGGNLGYMSQGRKKQDEKEKNHFDESIFLNKSFDDTFGFSKPLELPKEKSFIEKIVEFVKNLLKK